MSDERDKALEVLVSQLARNQPLRRAPASLEQRVLAQLAAQRAVVPWWRKGFSHWPLSVRAVFLLATLGFVRLATAGALAVISFLGSREITGDALSWVQVGTRVAAVIEWVGSFLLHTIPPTWLYAAAAVGLVSYALLFGLGTVAYRTLYVER
jgi:hypothetical protein